MKLRRKTRTDMTSTEEIRNIITEVMQQQQTQLLEAAAETAENIIDQKLVSDGKTRKIESIKLKYEGNQRQLDHENKVMEIWKKTEEALEKGLKQKAHDLIQEGKKITKQRIKLIRLADRESWAVVKAYESDDLASDTDDEKRIQKAIRTAKAKIKPKKPYEKPEEKPKEKAKPDKFKWDSVVCYKCGRFTRICPNGEKLFFPSTKSSATTVKKDKYTGSQSS